MAKYTKAEVQESIEFLRKLLPAGSTVYMTVTHVSRSGMQREIKALAAYIENGKPAVLNITRHVACAIEHSVGKHDGVVMGGCGMDMGFALVYELSRTLYRDDVRVANSIRKEWI